MTIDELRIEMMKAKKENPEKAKVLQAVFALAQLIAKEDGNRTADEKDIMSAAKKELKMCNQSKEAGAPFNPLTFEICESLLPKTMTEDETINAIELIISSFPEKSIKIMGQVMGKLKSEYGDSIDPSLASGLVKKLLS